MGLRTVRMNMGSLSQSFFLKGWFVVLLSGTLSNVLAQKVRLDPIVDKEELDSHYFFRLTEHGRLIKTENEFFYFSFKEEHLFEGERTLSLGRTHSQPLTTVSIAVVGGLNHYRIDLSNLDVSLNQNTVYELSYGRKKVRLMILPPSVKQKPEVTIVTNPVFMDCESTLDNNLVEYFATVTSGSPPYDLTWLVFADANKQSLLATPYKQRMKFSGGVASISLTNAPEYTIVLGIVDGCEQYVEKTLNIVCGSQEDDGLTIFLENTNVQNKNGNTAGG